MKVPQLGPNVPRQGGPLTAAFGRLALRLMRWRIESAVPDVGRAVMIVAPHTSNWDFPVGLAAKFALRLRVHWLGKHSIFRYGLGHVWRPLGGIAVDRRAPAGVVNDVLAEFRRRDRLLLGVAPEGTRKKVEQWKSGFYRIAQAAGVPIAPVAFDYSRRTIVFFPLFEPTGDYEADLARLQSHYSAEMACRPENFTQRPK
jgi:1-acyl-sn-glycerol-3-phosphate acyltransferase